MTQGLSTFDNVDHCIFQVSVSVTGSGLAQFLGLIPYYSPMPHSVVCDASGLVLVAYLAPAKLPLPG